MTMSLPSTRPTTVATLPMGNFLFDQGPACRGGWRGPMDPPHPPPSWRRRHPRWLRAWRPRCCRWCALHWRAPPRCSRWCGRGSVACAGLGRGGGEEAGRSSRAVGLLGGGVLLPGSRPAGGAGRQHHLDVGDQDLPGRRRWAWAPRCAPRRRRCRWSCPGPRPGFAPRPRRSGRASATTRLRGGRHHCRPRGLRRARPGARTCSPSVGGEER